MFPSSSSLQGSQGGRLKPVPLAAPSKPAKAPSSPAKAPNEATGDPQTAERQKGRGGEERGAFKVATVADDGQRRTRANRRWARLKTL